MLVAGTVAFDLLARVEALPPPDTAGRALELVERLGGCGGNVAMALARLGHRPRLLSAVGSDFAGSAYERALREAGVELGSLVRDPGRPTARAVVVTDGGGRQSIVYHEGATPAMRGLAPTRSAFGHFGPGELAAYPRLMDACDRVTFDPGQEVFHRSLDEVMACVERADIVLCNKHEAERLAAHAGGLARLAEGLDALVVTDSEGQTLHTPRGRTRVPAAPARAVDPTGAGDAHRAGFVHGLSQGWELEKCSQFGSVLAAFALEAVGAQEGLPDLKAAMERYRATYD